jgi:hypothetical protein
MMRLATHYPPAATALSCEGRRYRSGCKGLMRCPNDLTDVPHGPTPCTPDATLCNDDPTLHGPGRTCLPVELTESLIERTSLE